MDRHKSRRNVIVHLPRKNGGGKKAVGRRLLFVLLFFLLLWSFLSFIRSDFFRVEAVIIEGNVHTPEEEIRRAMQVGEGVNLWQVSPSLLRHRVEAIPRIEHALVERVLPRTLHVTVTEKRVLGLLPYRDVLFEVGMDGQILGSTREPQKYGLPLLTGVMPMEVVVGGFLLQEERLAAVVETLLSLDKVGLAVSELNLADPDNLVLVTMDGLVVWLGDGEFAKKAELLAQIAVQLAGKKTSGYLDLRVKDAPAFNATENNLKH